MNILKSEFLNSINLALLDDVQVKEIKLVFDKATNVLLNC